jgi:hypothetical protein
VKADLKSLTEPISVEPILTEALAELRRINLALVEQEKPHLHKSARVILDLVQDVFAPNTIPAIGRVHHVEGGVDYTFVDLPAQMMARLGYWRLET